MFDHKGISYLPFETIDGSSFTRRKFWKSWKYKDAAVLMSQPWKEITQKSTYDLIKNICTEPSILWFFKEHENKSIWCNAEVKELLKTPRYRGFDLSQHMSKEEMQELLESVKKQELELNKKLGKQNQGECSYKPTSISPSEGAIMKHLAKKGVIKVRNPLKYVNQCQQEIGFLIAYITNTSDHNLSNIKISYKLSPISETGEELKKSELQKDLGEKQAIIKYVPYLNKGESLLWLLAGYRKDSNGFPDYYISSVVSPLEIQYQLKETAEIIKKTIRPPLKNKAIKKYIPYGWHGQ